MELNSVKEKFTEVEQSIQRAEQACRTDQKAPKELQDWIKQLGTKTQKARTLVQQGKDEDGIRQTIGDLEQTGDRAKQACEKDSGINQQLKSAVMQAHQQLSELKRQVQ